MEVSPIVEILNQEIDAEGKTPSYYRILFDGKHIKYITIDPGIYEIEDLCFPPVLLKKLPGFPGGSWNSGRISQVSQSTELAVQTWKEELPSIKPLWHSGCYEYTSLTIESSLKSHVYKVTSPRFQNSIVAKHTRFTWDVAYYSDESLAYSWIQGHGIGPDFLGYVAEEGRVVGFLLEFVTGRHASANDLVACELVVKKLHSLGILHGDLNKHNFLITGNRAVLLDFETARITDNVDELQGELEGLKSQLDDASGLGGVCIVEEERQSST